MDPFLLIIAAQWVVISLLMHKQSRLINILISKNAYEVSLLNKAEGKSALSLVPVVGGKLSKGAPKPAAPLGM